MKKLFIFLLLISTFLKVYPVFSNSMPFTMDQGRDMIDVRQIWERVDIRLIGPTTSLNGVYLGPFYYYLISIPYLLFSGSPVSLLIWQIICFQLAVVYFWYTVSKQNSIFAMIASLLLLFSPVGFYTARYFWNANFMPVFSIIFLTLLYKGTFHATAKNDFLIGLVSGLSLQIEAALGIIFFPFTLIFLFLTKSPLPRYSRVILAFLITLLPQLMFEVKHGFPMTKVFVSEVGGATKVLGESLTFSERLVQRKDILIGLIRESSHVPFEYLVPIYWLLLLYFVINFFKIRKNKMEWSANLSLLPMLMLVVSAIFYLIFGSLVKTWYVLGLIVPVILFVSCQLSDMISKNKHLKYVVIFFCLFALYHGILAQNQHINNVYSSESNDPSGFANQLKVIDDVYNSAKGEAFYVYNYLPSIYDYPFQYLFWWYGLNRFGYMPNDLAYLPKQPEYIKDRESFLSPVKTPNEKSKIFLIVQRGENKSHLQEWFGNFAQYCQIELTKYSFNQELMELQPCQK